MNCILIERDVNTVYEQHVVDLDQVAFTCNSQIGYTSYLLEKPQRLIRGIILPSTVLFHQSKDYEPQGGFENDEVLINSLSEPQQQKIYGMFDEQKLYNVWKYIVCPAISSNSLGFYRYDDMRFQKTIEALRQFYFNKATPLMLCHRIPFRRVYIERDGKRHFVDKMPEKMPILVQPKVFIGISNKCQACTRYGYADFRDHEYCFSNRYSNMICEKLRGFRE